MERRRRGGEWPGGGPRAPEQTVQGKQGCGGQCCGDSVGKALALLHLESQLQIM